MSDSRDDLIALLKDVVWPFLAHDPDKPEIFWGLMADKILDSEWLRDEKWDLVWQLDRDEY